MSFFRSVRANVLLFFVLAAASALGTLVPQMGENPAGVEKFLQTYPLWGRVLDFLWFFNLYHSPWFLGLLGLMAFNIVVCKLWNAPPDPGLSEIAPELSRGEDWNFLGAELRKKSLNGEGFLELPLESARSRVRGLLLQRGFRVQEEPSSFGTFLVSTKHPGQRWGSYISHISLVVILLGALVKGLFGFEEFLPVVEGGSQNLRQRPWEVFVDRFEVEYYPQSKVPRLFASQIRVYDHTTRKHLGSKRILVNDPLALSGGRIYQASWGATGRFRRARLLVQGVEVDLEPHQKVRIPSTSIEVQADRMLPQFAVSADQRPQTESLEYDNPAVRFVFYYRGRRMDPVWLLLHWPRVSFREKPDGTLAHAPAPPFLLAALDPVFFSGLQVAQDPGFPIIVTGSATMLLGLSLLFYLHRRRTWCLLRAEGPKKSRWVLGGWSSRGPVAFRKEFSQILEAIEGGAGERLPHSREVSSYA
ncbi:MAG: cytochrome c biogenesis protein ResB [Elusimicrobia bacterium]|nr:cytochrome c biogenesis protein ResB [Elusimicrobiota bacterium]